MTPSAISWVDAPAKLTTRLRITGVRPDGYHLIDAEMVTLDLCDRVGLRRAEDATSTTAASGSRVVAVTGRFGAGVPVGADNLVARSLDAFGVAATEVTLDKRIPHGGGLGGGSADAAAALRWAGVGTSDDELRRAAELGADIAFCLVGGRAAVRGIGEIVTPLPPVALTVTLVVPPLRVSTPAAYRAWDELGGPTDAGPNDLEPAAIAVEPRLAEWRDAIAERTGCRPVLAGSGATWFVEGRRERALADLVDEGALVVEAVSIADGRER